MESTPTSCHPAIALLALAVIVYFAVRNWMWIVSIPLPEGAGAMKLPPLAEGAGGGGGAQWVRSVTSCRRLLNPPCPPFAKGGTLWAGTLVVPAWNPVHPFRRLLDAATTRAR